MHRFTTFMVVAVAAAMAVPAASAAWGFYGTSEPQGTYNANGGYMWTDAPPGGNNPTLNRVYFHAFELMGPNAGLVTPNSAALQSRMSTAGPGSFSAILGVWVDCNGDGFIGLGDTGALEYTASASAAAGHPVDSTRCPDTAPDAAVAPDSGSIPTHNHGGWITELLPIGPTQNPTTLRQNWMDAANETNFRILYDSNVRVWGERYEPVTPSAAVTTDACGQANVLPPFSKGETSHTGGILTQVNCDESIFAPTPHTLYQIATGAVPALSAVPDPSSLWAPGGHGDVQTFGTEQSCTDGGAPPCSHGSNAIVYGAEDCSKPPVASAGQTPVGGQGQNLNVYPPGQPQVNPKGTAPATINETYQEALDGCSGTDGDWNVGGGSGVLYPASGIVYGNGVAETATADNQQVSNKVAAMMNFVWDGPQPRGNCDTETAWQQAHRQNPGNLPTGSPFPADPLGSRDPAVVPALDCGQPNSATVQQTGAQSTDMWNSGISYIDTVPTTGARNRANLDTSTSPPTYHPDTFTADWYTFYASVTYPGLAEPGSVGQYGSEFCGGQFGPGVTSIYAWNCDPAKWNIDPTTNTKDATAHWEATVGDTYNLRDVVCHDTTLVGAGSQDNLLHQDIGGRTVGAINNPNHGCS